MSRLNEYNPEFGVVFDEIDDAINAALGNAGAPPGGGGAPKPPAGGLPNFPEGTKFPAGATNRGIAPNGLWYEKQSDGSVKEGYPASQADRAAVGAGPVSSYTPRTGTTGGANTNYAEKSLQDKIATLTGLPGVATKEGLLSQGARALGGNYLVLPNGDKYSLRNDGTGLYGAFGRVSATEARQLASQQMAANVSGNRTPEASNLTPEARPYAGLGGLNGLGGTLEARNGPVIAGLDNFRQPGIGIPSEGRQNISGVERGLNTMTAGRQGSLTQFPVAPGFRREGDVGNSINFASGNTATGTLEPQMTFAPTSVNVPGTYVYGQGNTGAANAAYSVPFNIGTGGAGLMNIGGTNVQLNSADRGTGYGYALNAMPASSVFAATGRNPSEDPASQAAQTLMLNSALAQFGGGPGALAMINAANGNQFSGYHAGTGNGFFSGNGGSGQGTYWAGYNPDDLLGGGGTTTGGAGFGPDGPQYYAGGGRVAVLPLGSPATRYAAGGMMLNGPMMGGPKSMVTNGPKYLIDAKTGRVEAVMGEDNADRGTAPNREMLRFSGPNNSMLKITPLEPPRFATGGDIVTSGGTGGLPNWQTLSSAEADITGGGGLGGGGFGGGGASAPIDNTPPATPPAPNPTNPSTPAPVVPPEPVPGSQPLPPSIPNIDVYDPNILQPWQQAAQQLAQQQHLRDVIDEPRRRAAGMIANSATGLPVLQGDVPEGQLGPGMYYDPSGQVNRVISDILGTQANLKDLGPIEDMTPVQQRATYLGNALDDLQRIRDLEIAMVAADAGVGLDTQGGIDIQAGLQAAQQGYQNLLNSAGGGSVDPGKLKAAQDNIDYWTNLANKGGTGGYNITTPSSSSGRAAIIQAQIDALKARLPAGANEADLKTELAQLNDQLSRNQKRINLTQQVANLAKVGVPRLNGPIIPVNTAAPSASYIDASPRFTGRIPVGNDMINVSQ